MRFRLLLAGLAGLILACGFLGEEPEVPAAPPPVAAPEPAATPAPEPTAPTDAPPTADAAAGAPQSHKYDWKQGTTVTYVDAEIPEGAVLAEVKTDYEHLYKAGAIDACPEGTTLQEKKRGDIRSSFCGLSNGVRHGPWIDFWENGKIREIGPYVAGKRHGTFTTWDTKGKLTSRYTFENGTPGPGTVF